VRIRRDARSPIIAAAAAAAVATAFVSGIAGAQTPLAAPIPAPAAPERVPLAENFSTAEIAVIAGAAVGGGFLLALGHTVLPEPTPSLGAPHAGSLDRRLTDRLHLDDGSGGRFLGGVPAVAGIYVLPFLPAAYYGAQLTRGWPRPDVNADHRLLAFAEALGWTMLVTGATKYLVGRSRPYVELGRPELRASKTGEADLSFFSGHSSAMFCAASFVARDAGGIAIPAAAYATATLVAVSRVIDQQHWPSDVLMGALVGGLTAHLVYTIHFDGNRRPRRRRAPSRDAGAAAARIIPTAGGIAVAGLLP